MAIVAKRKETTWTPERIKALREELGLDQAELAAKLRTSQGVISSWERGKRRPSSQTCLLLDLLAGKKF